MCVKCRQVGMHVKNILILISTICRDVLVEGLQEAMLELPA